MTRGPSLDPHEKRLAVHVEDHPIDYAPFEGTIPKGEYGGGTVIVWDEGTWTPEIDPAKAMKKGHISFELKGNKLNGLWHLVRLKPRAGEKRDNWLLIKSDDAAARPGEDILKDAPKSVKSGLTIEEVAEGKTADGKKPKVWHSNKPGRRQGEGRQAPRLHRAAAGDAGARGAARQGLAARSQIRRLPHAGADRRHRGAAADPHRPRLDGEIRRRDRCRTGPAEMQRRHHRWRDRRARRQRRFVLLAAAAGSVGQPHQPLHLLRLRPDAARRQGFARASRWSSASRRCRSCSASRPTMPPSASATISPNPARSCCSMPAAWGWKASSPSAPTRPIAAAAARAG